MAAIESYVDVSEAVARITDDLNSLGDADWPRIASEAGGMSAVAKSAQLLIALSGIANAVAMSAIEPIGVLAEAVDQASLAD